ncbi:hypothetical protein LOTGIDRAFT_160704 [Lottia gigantea]|uniref:Uncharacterized protein n=1 Tax=Lottia gigantea TaxID=225164 RepID=V4AMW9_LOTGI|nr:hypothetical protein LOTGIDRAFT_160704 [Lottia gigantea]ESO94951.1 hypothetical protein LOTGIDRAFT_160704 [Lottia gigantea]
MEPDIAVWRAQIGYYTHRSKSKTEFIRLNSLTFSVFLVINVLILLSGDVETNPGPTNTRQGLLSNTGNIVDPAGNVGLTSLAEMIENLRKEISELRVEVRDMNIKDEVIQLRTDIRDIQSDNTKLRLKLDATENRLRQKNLIFYGIGEKLEGIENWQDSEKLIRRVISNDLKIEGANDDSSVGIDRVYRIGRKQVNARRPRPIIVTFDRLKTRDLVLDSDRKSLRDSDISISEDYSERVRSIRRGLIPHLKEAQKDKEKKIKLRYDKLIIDKNVFTYDLNKKELITINK